MILSENVSDEKIFLFFSLLGNSIPHLVRLSGRRRMMFLSGVLPGWVNPSGCQRKHQMGHSILACKARLSECCQMAQFCSNRCHLPKIIGMVFDGSGRTLLDFLPAGHTFYHKVSVLTHN